MALTHVASLGEIAVWHYVTGIANSELLLDHLALKKYLSYGPLHDSYGQLHVQEDFHN